MKFIYFIIYLLLLNIFKIILSSDDEFIWAERGRRGRGGGGSKTIVGSKIIGRINMDPPPSSGSSTTSSSSSPSPSPRGFRGSQSEKKKKHVTFSDDEKDGEGGFNKYLENNFILKKTVSTSIDKFFTPLFEDVYRISIKNVIIAIKRKYRKRKILRKIEKYLKAWWKLIYEKMTEEIKYTSYAKKKLSECFIAAGISAYKKTIMDHKVDNDELLFNTLNEFKELCLIEFYGPDHLIHAQFELVNDVSFLKKVKKSYPKKKEIKN